MSAIDMLMQEHRTIEQVLDCLESLANDCAESGTLDVSSAGQAIHFFTTFADRCHHGKDEGCLFPLLKAKGLFREHSPTEVMIHEHEEGCRHVRDMSIAVNAFAEGHHESTNTFVRHARAFTHGLRLHIQKEDHCLFQMVERFLNESDQLHLTKQFSISEQYEKSSGEHQKCLDIAANLAHRYGISGPAQLQPNSGGPCDHSDPVPKISRTETPDCFAPSYP